MRRTRNKPVVDETAQYLESLKVVTRRSVPSVRAAIERALDGKKISFSDNFSTAVEQLLLQKLTTVLDQMVLVSKHRCADAPGDNTAAAWLLHKEDLAVFLAKKLDQIPPFTPEYAAHAAEEAARNQLTAQSVRRLTLRDLLPFIHDQPRLLQSLCRREILSEYTT